jgi:hypothetical protein
MFNLNKINLSSKQLKHNYEMHKPSLQKRLSKAEFQKWEQQMIQAIYDIRWHEEYLLKNKVLYKKCS